MNSDTKNNLFYNKSEFKCELESKPYLLLADFIIGSRF